ncbi:MAG: hypothetical protein ACR2GY_13325 [Phycisphaerales bacterium]
MAARSGAGTGVVVGLVVFVLSTVFLLVLTIVFYSKQETALQERDEARTALRKYVTPVEQTSDNIKAVVDRSGGSSVVQHLLEEQRKIMTKVLGDGAAGYDDLERRLGGFTTAADRTYLSVLEDLRRREQQAKVEVTTAVTRAEQSQKELAEARQLTEQTRANAAREVEAVRGAIETYSTDVRTYAGDVNQTKAQVVEGMNRLQDAYKADVDRIQRRLDDASADLALRTQQINELRDKLGQYQQLGATPELLVDGTILESPDSRGQVFISRGKNDHITLGMTFEVYDDASLLAPDQFGNIPRGKASVQVIKVGDTTSTATITRSVPGRPVVRDDVIANAIYDPDKVFSFLVHGKFDVDGDGRPSEWEAGEIRTMVKNWGGKVIEGDELRGDLDFLLLGVQPHDPPELRDNPTPEEVEIWVQQKAAVETYRKLLRDAANASIPVLNQNRFFILIGHTYQ